MSNSPPTSGGALNGVRVIDLSRVLGGPYCTQILGDHGADVIKIEPPAGDETRTWGPPFEDGTASYFVGVNRNKRTIALDLAQESGRAVLLRLLDDADVLVENFKSGTMERWGLGYEAVLRHRFPRLVYCQVTGFGDDGPLGGRAGYDAAIQANTGLMSVNGEADGGPLRIGVPIVDMGTGLYALSGILMALLERTRSGLGQRVDATLWDSAIALLHPHLANHLMSGKPPRRTGSAHPNVVPYDRFDTATVPIFLAVGNDRQFRRFCEVIGLAAFGRDPRFATNQARNLNRGELTPEITRALAGLDGNSLAETLMAEGVPCAPVLAIPDVAVHPHTRHRAMVVEQAGYRAAGIPVKLSRTPGAVTTLPRPLGADTRAVLEAAGYAAEEIEALLATGAAVGASGLSNLTQ